MQYNLKIQTTYLGLRKPRDTRHTHKLLIIGRCNETDYTTDFFNKTVGFSFTLKRELLHKDWPNNVSEMLEQSDIPIFVAFIDIDLRTLVLFTWATYGFGVYDADTGAPLATYQKTFELLTNHRLLDSGRYLYMTHENIYFGPVCGSLWHLADFVRSQDGHKEIIIDNLTDSMGAVHISNDGNHVECVPDVDPAFQERVTIGELYSDPHRFRDLFRDLCISSEFDNVRRRHECMLHAILRRGRSGTCSVTFASGECEQALHDMLFTDASLLVSTHCVGNQSGDELDCHAYSLLKMMKDDAPLNIMMPRTLFPEFSAGIPGVSEIDLTFTFRFQERCNGPVNGIIRLNVRQKLKARSEGAIIYKVDPTEPCMVCVWGCTKPGGATPNFRHC